MANDLDIDVHRGNGRRFIVHAHEKLSAFIELERQVLTVTFSVILSKGVTNDALLGLESF